MRINFWNMTYKNSNCNKRTHIMKVLITNKLHLRRIAYRIIKNKSSINYPFVKQIIKIPFWIVDSQIKTSKHSSSITIFSIVLWLHQKNSKSPIVFYESFCYTCHAIIISETHVCKIFQFYISIISLKRISRNDF